VLPRSQAGLAGNVFEEDGAVFDITASGDRPMFGVKDRSMRASGVDTADGGRLSTLAGLVGLCIGGVRVRRGGLRNQTARSRGQRDAYHHRGKFTKRTPAGSALKFSIP
jgi:hypothetical protein